VFDLAADDDVSDDDEVDLPFTEVVPGEDDETAALAADDAPFTHLGDETASLDGEAPASPGDREAAARDEDATAPHAQTSPGDSGVAALGGDATDLLAEASSGDGGVAALGGDATDLLAEASPGDGGAAALGGDESASVGLSAEAAAVAGAAVEGAGRARPGSGIPAQGRGVGGSGAAVGGLDARTENDLETPPMDDAELRAALEAILLVVDEPVAEMQLAQIVEQPTERVAAMLEDISARYTAAGHGFDLRRAAGGWRLYTRPEYAPYVERFVLDGQSVRLTQASLETLAVVAYKQPVTRSRISAIRGVNCDGVMRTLVTRGLIEECGTESETGAFLYRTTPLFLEKLGLNSVDQLPPLAPFLPDDVEEVLDASG
jgi:segregation and condensation protein B